MRENDPNAEAAFGAVVVASTHRGPDVVQRLDAADIPDAVRAVAVRAVAEGHEVDVWLTGSACVAILTPHDSALAREFKDLGADDMSRRARGHGEPDDMAVVWGIPRYREVAERRRIATSSA